ncbi:hypothetical protein Syun_014021 [Stephania yunnanensis]|uniref:F-box domain-containing protein n=1 Tax=Stephania yunnanensis TaxID=152371 RepID=A0AAP0JII1_9MAGN
MESLPHEILIDIVTRLPITSLMQFKCVSKAWYSLAQDHYLLHIRHDESHLSGLYNSHTGSKGNVAGKPSGRKKAFNKLAALTLNESNCPKWLLENEDKELTRSSKAAEEKEESELTSSGVATEKEERELTSSGGEGKGEGGALDGVSRIDPGFINLPNTGDLSFLLSCHEFICNMCNLDAISNLKEIKNLYLERFTIKKSVNSFIEMKNMKESLPNFPMKKIMTTVMVR